MTYDQESRQTRLNSRIRSRASELGYDLTKVEPIYDGVVDWDGYLKAPLKVCWILKEPYDDTVKVQATGNARCQAKGIACSGNNGCSKWTKWVQLP